MDGVKVCFRCKEEKNLSEFYFSKKEMKYSVYCKVCCRRRSTEYRNRKAGYVVEWGNRRTTHKYSRSKDDRLLLHRSIMSKIIGRPLKAEEVVHHVNNDPKDNRQENLMLFPNNTEHKKHHAKLRRRFFT
jgi:hypothetical protein